MAGILRSPEPTANNGQCPDIFTAEFKGSPGHIRVLKPPGGGSSDIFGGDEGNNTTPSRPASKHHLKSSLFVEPPASPAPTTNGNTEIMSNGTPNGTPNGTTNGTTNGHVTPKGNKSVARNPVTGEGLGDSQTRSARKREGRNPVTGEGYTGDEKDSSSPMQHQPRHRVPPGGYTTPLW
ncbi:microtubule-associated protein Jupiter isoform X2 [Hetaerina americana]|uniref:microtubule-associated protein Jupiter isoform X2 n=1 Tax=Hetaerina americana TaxID=62018 RepID=UPI003A7F1727